MTDFFFTFYRNEFKLCPGGIIYKTAFDVLLDILKIPEDKWGDIKTIVVLIPNTNIRVYKDSVTITVD